MRKSPRVSSRVLNQSKTTPQRSPIKRQKRKDRSQKKFADEWTYEILSEYIMLAYFVFHRRKKQFLSVSARLGKKHGAKSTDTFHISSTLHMCVHVSRTTCRPSSFYVTSRTCAPLNMSLPVSRRRRNASNRHGTREAALRDGATSYANLLPRYI